MHTGRVTAHSVPRADCMVAAVSLPGRDPTPAGRDSRDKEDPRRLRVVEYTVRGVKLPKRNPRRDPRGD
jgi:hypothetical protein